MKTVTYTCDYYDEFTITYQSGGSKSNICGKEIKLTPKIDVEVPNKDIIVDGIADHFRIWVTGDRSDITPHLCKEHLAKTLERAATYVRAWEGWDCE